MRNTPSKENIFTKQSSYRKTFTSLEKTVKRKPQDRMITRILTKDYERSNSQNSQTRSNYESQLMKTLNDSQDSVRQFALKQTTKKTQVRSNKILQSRQCLSPWKTIGVPGWKDNYYSNLLDWSYNNFLIIAYGVDCFLYNMALVEDDGTPNYKRYKISDSEYFLTSVKSSPNQTKFAVGYSNGVLKIYDYYRAKLIQSNPIHESRIATLCWESPLLVSGSKDQTIRITDIRQHNTAQFLPKYHIQQICGVKQEGNFIASGGNDNQVCIYDIRKLELLSTYSHQAAVKALTWLNDGKTLITGGGTADKKIKFWTDKDGVYKQIDTGSQVCSLLTSKTTTEIVSCQGFSLNQIVLWNYEGERLTTLHGHTSRVLYSALSPLGNLLASGAGDQTLKLWKMFPEFEKSHQLVLPQLR